MSKSLRAAVIGVGYLGRFHAQKYAALPNVELVGVVDPDPETRRRRGQGTRHRCLRQPCANCCRPGVDLVSIASTTESHYRIARDCLAAGLHVLVEKPITVTVAEADELIALAAAGKLMLQVGHLERYNPAWLAVRDKIGTPLFIEAHRMAPFKPRGTDVSVVLDLMIHDLDLILPLVQSPVADLRASGVAVLTEGIDIANARIEFANGCVANITASRASTASLRRMRIFQHHEYLSIDFGERKIGLAKKRDAIVEGEAPIDSESRVEPPGDALLSEIQAFVASVRGEVVPGGTCSGRDGREALAVALEIERLMLKQGKQ
jgi:predicted dehydrogenase